MRISREAVMSGKALLREVSGEGGFQGGTERLGWEKGPF